ncbi:MAG TPA: ABC transporter ATP-binding protein [Clostridia bacterium]|nr:ABC transporter ATP-binding protein [Clostridia bacterium]
MNNYIEVKGVQCFLDNRKVLDDINLSIGKKEIVSIIGPNGSGKTTLSKIIIGIVKYSHGTVALNGREVKEMTLGEIGKKIGYLFQNPDKQIFTPTVYEELSFAYGYNNNLNINNKEESIDEILEIFDLKHLKNNSTYFLSPGEKQRLALASILINKPEFLILDEPTTGLDYKRKETLSKLLKRYENQLGILLISHDMNFVKKHAHRTLLMESGCIIGEI